MFKNNSLLRSILAVLIVFIPLYPKFPLTNVTGTYVAIRLDDIVIALSIGVLFLNQLRHGFPLLKLKITKLILAYYLAIITSLFISILIFQTDSSSLLLLNTLRRLEYSSLIFLTIATIQSLTDFKFVYFFQILATIGVIIYGLGQKYFNFPVVSTMNSEFSKGQLLQMNVWTRISSTFAGHYDLAAYLSLVLVIIGGVIVISKNIFLKIGSIIIWLSSFYILTLTASRVSTFAFYGAMILTLILLRRYLWIIPVTLVFSYSLINSKDLNQRLLATIPALKNQFFQSSSSTPTPKPTSVILASPTVPVTVSIISPSVKPTKPVPTVFHHGPTEEYLPIDSDVGVARSGEIRFNVEWPRAITAFKKNPLTGTGLGSITLATDNDYLRALGESGLLGFTTFGVIFFFFTKKTWPHFFAKKLTIYDTLPIIFFGGMVSCLLNATLIDVFEASKPAYIFWIMMGLYYRCLFIKKS